MQASLEKRAVTVGRGRLPLFAVGTDQDAVGAPSAIGRAFTPTTGVFAPRVRRESGISARRPRSTVGGVRLRRFRTGRGARVPFVRSRVAAIVVVGGRSEIGESRVVGHAPEYGRERFNCSSDAAPALPSAEPFDFRIANERGRISTDSVGTERRPPETGRSRVSLTRDRHGQVASVTTPDMDTITPLNVIVDNITEMIGLFGDVAMGAGLAPLLVLIGTLLIIFSMGVFGVLTLGAVGDLFTAN